MSNEKKKKFKIKGHGSFYLREGWLNKGINSLLEDKFLFYNPDVIDTLGVGSNMVTAIRYWLQATGIFIEKIEEKSKRSYHLSEFGERILKDENDPYFEDLFSWYLIHYNLVKNKELATSWNLFFNNINSNEIDKEEMFDVIDFELREYVGEQKFSEKSLRDDCNCIIHTYYKDVSSDKNPEDKTTCPLSELGLISKKKERGREVIYKTMPSESKMSNLVILYVIMDNCTDGKISINDILTKENNIGKVFNLNRNRVNMYLDKLKNSGYITINRTSGLDMVYLNDEYIKMDKFDLIDQYFKR